MSEQQDLHPRVAMLALVMQKIVIQSVWALTKLGVPEHLADGPRTVEDLARRTGADPEALARTLTCTAGHGVFTREPDGRFSLSPMADHLRAGHPQSVRDLVLMNGEEMLWRPYGRILHTLRTGEPAFDTVFGTSFFGYLDEHPDLAAVFHGGMTDMTIRMAGLMVDKLDLSAHSHIADIGGGEGHLLAEILGRHPGTTGLLMERPAALEGAATVFKERNLADRVSLVTGDFFAEVPAGCDAYVLKHVLHDWNDRDATRILRRVREAIGDRRDARVYIVEHVLSPDRPRDLGTVLDIDMMVVCGGKERGVAQWRDLVEAGGFDLVRDPEPGQWSVVTGRPR